MTTLAQLHDCHSCNDERSILPKKGYSISFVVTKFGLSSRYR